jgi:predicted aspartyl protease
MIEGGFYKETPYVQITLGSGLSVQTPLVVLDTEFTGDLQVTPQIADDLRLEVRGKMPIGLADGTIIDAPISIAYAKMEGELHPITVQILKGTPLMGIGFLTKFNYRAIVNCKYRTVFLERV